MVGVDVLSGDEFVVAELNVSPLSILTVVSLEIVLEVTTEDEDGFVEFDSFL